MPAALTSPLSASLAPSPVFPKLVFFRRAAFALFALSLPVSLAAANAAFGVVAGACLFLWIADPSVRRFRWTGVEIAWGLYLLWSLFSALASFNPSRSLHKLSSEYLIAAFFLCAQFQDDADARRTLRFYLAGIAVAAAWGVLQHVSGVNWIPDSGALHRPDWAAGWPDGVTRLLAARNERSTGFFSHPLTYAEVLLVGWTLFVGESLRKDGARQRAFAAGGLLTFAALIFSESRAVWLSLPVILFIWAVVTRERKILALLSLLLLAGSLAVAAHPVLRRRAVSLLDVRRDVSSVTRLEVWRESMDQIPERPFFGAGKGLVELPVGRTPETRRVWTESHNIYLQMAVERGIPGLAFYLLFLAALGRVSWRAYRAGASPGFFFGFVGLLLAGLTESWSHDAEVVMNLYFVTGCAFALARLGARVKPDGSAPTSA